MMSGQLNSRVWELISISITPLQFSLGKFQEIKSARMSHEKILVHAEFNSIHMEFPMLSCIFQGKSQIGGI